MDQSRGTSIEAESFTALAEACLLDPSESGKGRVSTLAQTESNMAAMEKIRMGKV